MENKTIETFTSPRYKRIHETADKHMKSVMELIVEIGMQFGEFNRVYSGCNTMEKSVELDKIADKIQRAAYSLQYRIVEVADDMNKAERHKYSELGIEL
jgi:hypothetical protein